jgi:hypothetical protein
MTDVISRLFLFRYIMLLSVSCCSVHSSLLTKFMASESMNQI